MSDDSTAYTGWAVIELMGHRRIAGHVSEAAQYGTAMIRIDVPTEDGQPPITQFYGGNSIYCLSPVTEDVARAVARRNQPAPVSPYEILPPRRCRRLASILTLRTTRTSTTSMLTRMGASDGDPQARTEGA